MALSKTIRVNNVKIGSGALVGSFSTDGTLAGNSDSLVPTQKAVKTYVDTHATAMRWKEPVRAATTADGTFATAYANGQSVDGVTLVTGDRILLKNQTDQTKNGIYTVNASGAPTRATDADTAAELLACIVPVMEGTTNADSAWVNTNDTITLGSSNIAFIIFGGLKAGANLAITADVIALAPTTTIDLSNIPGGSDTTGTFIKIGATGTPIALNAAGQSGIKAFVSTTATSDTTYGEYIRLDVSGAGVEGIAARGKTLLKVASVGNAHGAHDTLELDTSAGNVTGLGTGHRGNIVVADRAVAAGTYYGAMAEIYPLGNTAALPANSNACLGINAQPGTAMDLVVNAIAFSGTDGDGKMIYTGAAPDTLSGSVRVLINGVVRYIPLYTNQHA